jgi:hypothetical protein
VHLNEGGSVPDRYAARAAMGLAVRIGEQGVDRLGVCAADGCGQVFFDTTASRSRRYCSDRCAAGRHGVAAADRPQVHVTEPLQHRPNGRTNGRNGDRNGGQGGAVRPAEKTAHRDGGQ